MESKTNKCVLTIHPGHQSFDGQWGDNLLKTALSAGINIHHPCNGGGICGKCKVHVIDGEFSPISIQERKLLTEPELENGVRLACFLTINGNATIEILESGKESGHRVEDQGLGFPVRKPDGSGLVRKLFLPLQKPSLHDSISDAERIIESSGCAFHPSAVLRLYQHLPDLLASSNYEITAVIAEEQIVELEAGDTSGNLFGAAVDIGTTTVVVSLIDLNTGEEVSVAADANEQRQFGQDVISRIQYAKEAGVEDLQRLIAGQLNVLLEKAAELAGVNTSDIYAVSVAANTTMLHLLLGVQPHSISVAPYQAAFISAPCFPTAQIGIRLANCAVLYIVPSVSSYVGGDIVAGVLATGMHLRDELSLLIDIGTNGEIVFGSKNGLLACSCAAGPALEGMNIACGMIAAEGAIESVSISGEQIDIRVIGEKAPIGICGSGIIDGISELLRNGIITPSGRMKDDLARFRLALGDNEQEIYISQNDVRQVQLAKGAISSAIEVLLKEAGVSAEKISTVYIAGAFGKHLQTESLIRTGFIPEVLKTKIVFSGNTAKSGAVIALLSMQANEEIERIREITRYFELSVQDGYETLFVKATLFPKLSIL